ncbi:acetyl-CoA carboxylase biotin carboxyl carrier protein subunit [Parabacteroides sp. FAFU027]|uniref:acetyl-CoA carboxylase biotin carboxyl carrier protein subunit n=1 Tax=Parabacteroides sp. FAFU027 TaxID=2922715 RepID=UPI001FAEAFE4|nr:acetyl-CoA carboxylase biotin carboxyl carrier protein subunit [Parabacteroides sp. FAFU027]
MEIHIGDRIANVELVSKDDNKVVIKIDEKTYELDVVMAENGICSILHDGKSFTAELKRAENGKKYTVNTAFNTFPVEIVDTQAKYLRNRRKDETDESQDRIYSPMPGKVVKILVDKGTEVEAGQPVIVIEAMKMQSEYKVKKTCTIKDILVKEGDAINSDQTLITLN